MDAEVHTGSWSFVPPSTPRENKVQPVSPLDNVLIPAAYPRKVLFFTRAGSEATSVIKESLAKALCYFYPLAGRLSFMKNKVQLQLHTNNIGASFLEATTTATLADLGPDILPSKFTDKLCQMEAFPEFPWREEYPLLSVQVTRFACGGLSLGVTFSHQICDGVAFWHFMNSWAEIARLGKPLVAPDMSYSITSPEPLVTDEILNSLALVLTPREVAMRSIRYIGWKKLDDGIRSTLVKLSKDKLAQLKSLTPDCTTFQVASAYLWKRLAKTWQPDEKARLVINVSCRGKTPWLSPSYFGNAILAAEVETTAERLQNESGASTARLIKQTLEKCCARETIEAGIRLIHAYDGNLETIPFPRFPTGESDKCAMIIGSPRHRIYDIDFGWGRVSRSTFGAQDLGPNKISLFPSAENDGGIDAVVALDTKTMELFLDQQDVL